MSFNASVLSSNPSIRTDNETFRNSVRRMEAGFLLQFAGQGFSFFRELQEMYREDALLLGDFFPVLFRSIQEEMESPRMRRSDWYYDGFRLEQWLQGEPDAERLQDVVLSVPLVFALQVGHYLRFVAGGISGDELLERTRAVIGHSQGLHAAVFIAQGKSGPEFFESFGLFVKAMFRQGYRCREQYPEARIPEHLLVEEHAAAQRPSPMAGVREIAREDLLARLEVFHRENPELPPLYAALRNTRRTQIVVGPEESLALFRRFLNGAYPFEYLPVNIPFHSPYLNDVPAKLEADFEDIGLRVSGEDLRVPVLAPEDGADLREAGDLTAYLARTATINSLDWQAVSAKAARMGDITHILGFGPGDALERMTTSYFRGRGIVPRSLNSRDAAEDFIASPPRMGLKWSDFAPVGGKAPDGSPFILNAYSRFTGRPPVFGGGMTPTTVETDIVVAAANAGRVVEWAGGGQVTEAIMRARLDVMREHLEEGEGIVINLLYLDAYLWNLQYPLIRRLKKEGYPIEGATISAGVPETGEALEILDALEDAGIWLNSFKPGTTDQIRRVLEIARANTKRKIIMQVEGGAAGGHHSWEELDVLIRANYQRIRALPNVILAVGGGIHRPDQAADWLTGAWNREECMPVDAVILGTRLMAAREAHTADTIKTALADTRGDSAWLKGKQGEGMGGIVSGKSGLGADIHYAENHWSVLSSRLERLVSGKSADEIRARIKKTRPHLIRALNRTCKPYFGDVAGMTYHEVLSRFAELVCPGDRLAPPEGRWSDAPFIDGDYRARLMRLVERFEDRFAADEDYGRPAVLKHPRDLDVPEKFIEELVKHYPAMKARTLLPEDEQYFLNICRAPGKPVNFIPVLDENILKWYRGDSLWYAHCPGIDPNTCAWIPGPVSVGSIRKANEPVVDILKSFEEAVLGRIPATDEIPDPANMPAAAPAYGSAARFFAANGGAAAVRKGRRPDARAWAVHLASAGRGSIARLLQSPRIARGGSVIASDIPELLAPLESRKFRWECDDDGRMRVLSVHPRKSGAEGTELEFIEKGREVELRMYFTPEAGRRIPFVRRFRLDGPPSRPAREIMDTRVADALAFYREVWGVDPDADVFPYELTRENIDAFRSATDDPRFTGAAAVPLNMAVVLGWRAMIGALFTPEAGGDVFRLLHRSYEFNFQPEYEQLAAGDQVYSRAQVTSFHVQARGKTVRVEGELFLRTEHGEKNTASFASEFFIMDDFAAEAGRSYETRFEPVRIALRKQAQVELLAEQSWLVLETPPRPGDVVVLEFTSFREESDADGLWNRRFLGRLRRGSETIGAVFLEEKDSTRAQNPITEVLNLLDRGDDTIPLEKPYRLLSRILRAPTHMREYAPASGDFNPIHTDANFAVLAGLSEPIVHGMWTSSQALRLIIDGVCRGRGREVERFISRFEAPVTPGAELRAEIKHAANRNGARILKVEIRNESDDLVYQGDAVLRARRTAYVFTGQGSQARGMGMNFYDEERAVRELWDRVETLTNDELGFSLLRIVRENPESLRVNGETLRHPAGVLNLTQFTQPALVVKALADWTVLRTRGVLVENSCFAGHSLGEFAALACHAILDVESVVRIVYNRGLTMQNLVPRDEHGISPFAMSVILANRKLNLDEAGILELVEATANDTGKHLEVVNYNIRDRQYSVTGYAAALDVLEERLRKKARGHRVYKRLAGIDVPFHSSLLLAGVDDFRAVLAKHLHEHANYAILDGRYIPNLTARRFALSREFIANAHERSGSPVLAEILASDKEPENIPNLRRQLLIELLAYQFARPVQWIRTQDVLFREAGVERLIDLGARGDLAGMARQTLKEHQYSAEVLHIEENRSKVLYEQDDAPLVEPVVRAGTQETEQSRKEIPEAVEEIPVAESQPEVSAPAIQAPEENGVVLEDVRLNARDGLKTVLALKAGVRSEEARDDLTIDALFQGNSSKRNQALADLGAEFNTAALEGAYEKSLRDTADLLEQSVKYERPGSFLRPAFDEFIKACMPPGFARKEIFAHMADERLMPPGHVFAASLELCLLARSGPSAGEGDLSPIGIKERLPDAKQAVAWLDQALDLYGRARGIVIPRRARNTGGGGIAVDSRALEELEGRYFGLDGVFQRILRYGGTALGGEDPYARFLRKDREELEEKRQLQMHREEGGKAYEHSLVNLFDERKVVVFSQSVQWAKRNLLESFWNIVNERGLPGPAVYRMMSAHARDLAKMIDYLGGKARREGWSRAESFLRGLRDGRPESSRGRHRGEEQGDFMGFIPMEGPYRCGVNLTEHGTLEVHEKESGDYTEFVGELTAPRKGLGHFAEIRTTSDDGNSFQFDEDAHARFMNRMISIASFGGDLRGRTALVTGAGANSIALEVVRCLLAGGARVIVTTSSYSDARTALYRRVYQECGAPGSELIMAPFSQGSVRDVRALSEYIFKAGYEPDFLVPFGALSEENSVANMNGDVLAGVRVMLLGVHALIGEFANHYRANLVRHKKFQVILPLSPNHGMFGRDGMYAETKLALEALFRKWYSEQDDWGRFARIRGCRIGWVRGTGLMELNDVVAPGLEADRGVRTFHRAEMGFMIAGLMAAGDEMDDVVLADFTGGLGRVDDLRGRLARIRGDLLNRAAVMRELSEYREKLAGPAPQPRALRPLGGIRSYFPALPAKESLPRPLAADPADVVCVVGFGEIGPGGGSRTRWELEKQGELSIEGTVELAWTMGLIRHEQIASGYGWVDAASGDVLEQSEIRERYEKTIREGTGIRFVNAELQGFDPMRTTVYTDVVLEEDFYIPASNEEEARSFQEALPEQTAVYYDADKERWFVKRLKGTVIKIPKAVKLTRYAAGQIPDGWDAERYGIPRDLIQQVDRITLFNIVATAEAFVAAGMEPFELYRYLHPAEVGTTSGSGMGGIMKLKQMFVDPALDKKRQHDALQEALINVTAAWAVTSFIGSAGPVQTPVSACATAGISVDMALNLIQQGKARFMVAGAFDDLGRESMMGFGDMNATADTREMLEKGISPTRMCRPNDARRAGFLEAQGGGTLLLARGDLARDLGLPVYGVIAFSASHADGIHTSIPAPGKGLASVARERGPASRAGIEERDELLKKLDGLRDDLRETFGRHADKITRSLRKHLTMDFWRDESSVSPLRAALSVFGLTADDIAVVYKHDTSTHANDRNENRLHHEIQKALGRTPGNPLFVVSQKSLTGHSKGGAAAWQIIGLLQSMDEGILPPNRNLDSVDPEMSAYEDLVFSDRAIAPGAHRIRAGLVTTLGFGHVGAMSLILHPNFFLAMLDESERGAYAVKREVREGKSIRRRRGMRLAHSPALYARRTESPFTDDEQELRVFLDARARIASDLQGYPD